MYRCVILMLTLLAVGSCGPQDTPTPQPDPAAPAREAIFSNSSWIIVAQSPDEAAPQIATAFAISQELLATTARVTDALEAMRRADANVVVSLFRHHSGERREIELLWTHPDFDPDGAASPDVGLIRVTSGLPSFLETATDAELAAVTADTAVSSCGFAAVVTAGLDFRTAGPADFQPRATCIDGTIDTLRNNGRLPAQAAVVDAYGHSLPVVSGMSGAALFDANLNILGLVGGGPGQPRTIAPRSDKVRDLQARIASNLVNGFDFETGETVGTEPPVDPEEADAETCTASGACCPDDGTCDLLPCVGLDPDCSACANDSTCITNCIPPDPDCSNDDICSTEQRCCPDDARCDLDDCPQPDPDCDGCDADGACIAGCDPFDDDCQPDEGCTEQQDCDDGSFCNGSESCDSSSGACVGGAAPCSASQVCDESLDACVTTNACSGNTQCNDGQFCNGVEQCNPFTGGCTPGARPCDDSGANATQTCDEGGDTCQPRAGCTQDAECDDGLFCDGVETCNVASGMCLGGVRPCNDLGMDPPEFCTEGPSGALCNSFNACTIDADCDDGLFCNGVETCGGDLECVEGMRPCNDSGDDATETCNETADVCVPAGSCTQNADCDDTLFCNGVETCTVNTGDCQVGMAPCDDSGEDATEFCNESADTCNPLPDCTIDADCDDMLFCNGSETCIAGACEAGSRPCDDDDTPTETCDETADVCNEIPPCTSDADCDDGSFCNGAETCDVASGACMAGGDPCVDQACDEDNDTCEALPDCTIDTDCDDGAFCNGTETCDTANGSCVSGSDPCVDQGCDEDADACTLAQILLTDFTLIDADADVAIAAQDPLLDGAVLDLETLPRITIRANPQSSAVESVVFELLREGQPDHAQTENSEPYLLFADENGTDFLPWPDGGPDVGTAYTLNATPHGADNGTGPAGPVLTIDFSFEDCSGNDICSDGQFCNGAELCNAGACEAGTAVDCDDGVDCTVDTCDESADACDNTPDNGACDDGAFCNGVETCDGSGCVNGTAVSCDDGVACTVDTCNESTDGCDNVPDNSLCSDGLFCNGIESCTGTACAAGTRTCDDRGDTPTQSCDEEQNICRPCGTFVKLVPVSIPDGNPTGVQQTLVIDQDLTISDLDVDLIINHTWAGDLVVTLSNGSTTVVLIDHPGGEPPFPGSARDGFDITLDDAGSDGPIEDIPVDEGPQITGTYTPNEALSAFDGQSTAGTWTLTVSDTVTFQIGTLVTWTLNVTANECN